MHPSVVWFKRDLRLVDHTALCHAAQRGPVFCLYVIEPSVWATPDASDLHYQFLIESLRALDAELKHYAGRLHVVSGEVVDILDRLLLVAPSFSLYSHEETGNAISYQRDQAVGLWCRQRHIEWHECPQFGVTRGLKNRDHWKRHWDAHMNQMPLPQPLLEFAHLAWPAPAAPTAAKLGLVTIDRQLDKQRQHGGRAKGLAILDDFLRQRSETYRGGISSPLSAPTACSRLSPYLAFGCLSLREVVHATRAKLATVTNSHQKKGLSGFLSRLYWHCHFIQKLESEPQLEYANLHRGYDGLREAEWNQAHFDALVNARTGWPMVDACVTMLRETGWLNFRMRAMLVSVAAYPLWLHWRQVGLWLATQFLDYEPGIHWSQMQMQSGTTGINTARIYNPIKQAYDHDPHGIFVRRWLPAMRRVPDTWLFEPWRMPAELQAKLGLQVGVDIALPLVDLEMATRQAKARLYTLRAEPAVKAGRLLIVKKHGSRKSKPFKPDSASAESRLDKVAVNKRAVKQGADHAQTSFEFE